ncbi:MAG: beta-ketoacyl-ACP synthase II, partial [Gallionellales bacterium CG_4_8_14_3_um_filter_54_18]
MSKRRVVVTGLGMVSPVGVGIAAAWPNIVAGKSGIVKISHFDASQFACQIAGEVPDFDATQYLPAKDARRMGRFIHFGLVAGMEAFK